MITNDSTNLLKDTINVYNFNIYFKSNNREIIITHANYPNLEYNIIYIVFDIIFHL